MPTDLSQRLRTAAVMIAVVLGLLLAAAVSCPGRGLLLGAGVTLVLGAAWEFARMGRQGKPAEAASFFLCVAVLPAGMVACFIGQGICFPGEVLRLELPMFAGSGMVALLMATATMVGAGRLNRVDGESVARELFPAVVLIGFGGGALLSLMVLPGGPGLILWLALVVCLNDTAAYFGGSRFGGPKLAPAISPHKTLSGSACGIIAGGFAGAAAAALTPLSAAGALLLAIVLVMAAQLADLTKSGIKRLHGVKDSGSILPGHGGLLDRLDGVLGGAPVLYLALLNFGG